MPWNHGQPWEGESANHLHILGRGWTHLPFAQPAFGTPCAANAPRPDNGTAGAVPMSMMPDDDGMMGMTPHADGPDMD